MFKYIFIAMISAHALPAFADQSICDKTPDFRFEIDVGLEAEQLSDLKPHLQAETSSEFQLADLKPHLSTFGQVFLLSSINGDHLVLPSNALAL